MRNEETIEQRAAAINAIPPDDLQGQADALEFLLKAVDSKAYAAWQWQRIQAGLEAGIDLLEQRDRWRDPRQRLLFLRSLQRAWGL